MEWEICFEEYNENQHKPLFLSCGHTFCLAWLTEMKESLEEFSWPNWNTIINSEIADLPVNFSILSVRPFAVIPLSVSKSEQEDHRQEAFCKIHESKKIKFWCADCNTSFCSKCIDVHGGHKIESMEASMYKRIDADLLSINEQVSKVQAFEYTIDNICGEITAKNQVTRSSVIAHTEEIIKQVKHQEAEILHKIDDYLQDLTNYQEEVKQAVQERVDECEKQLAELRILRNTPSLGIGDIINRQAAIHNQVDTIIEFKPPCHFEINEIIHTFQELPQNLIGKVTRKRIPNPFLPEEQKEAPQKKGIKRPPSASNSSKKKKAVPYSIVHMQAKQIDTEQLILTRAEEPEIVRMLDPVKNKSSKISKSPMLGNLQEYKSSNIDMTNSIPMKKSASSKIMTKARSPQILTVHPAKPLDEEPKAAKRHGDYWWFTTNTHGWAAYTPVENRAIENAFKSGKTQFTIRKGLYTVDFQNMTQKNNSTGRVRDIARNKS